MQALLFFKERHINRLTPENITAHTKLTVWATLWNRVHTRGRRMFDRFTENRRLVRYSLLALNVIMLGAIGGFVLRGSNPSDVLSRSVLSAAQDTANPLDQLSSAEIARNAAIAGGLAETPGVIELADSVAAELAVSSADTTVVAKQQAVATSLKSRADIQDYVVQPGDTIASIAAKFNITSDSILWSNNLRSSTVSPGATLVIPPVNGIVYSVKAGDTPDSLAQRYRSNKDQIVLFNDIELTGLPIGERIVLPGGQQPAPVVRQVFAFTSPVYGGYNGYDRGFCTWYAANRRAEIGRAVPGGLGNASTWDDRGRVFGLTVNNTPAFGAVVVTSQRGAGHVAFVEKVNDDGSVWISEMNSRGQVSMTDSSPAGGWGRVDWKLIPAGTASSYNYIH